MGSTVVSGYLQCPFASDLIAHMFTQSFANGSSAWNSNGPQSFAMTVAHGTCPNYCGVTVADGLVPMALVDVEYTAGYGDPQPTVLRRRGDEGGRLHRHP